MTLTKADIIEYLCNEFGLNKKDSKDFVEVFFEDICSALESAHPVKISGFGNLDLLKKDARPGRNPRTLNPVEVSPRRVVVFHPGQKLKAKIDSYSLATITKEEDILQ